MIAFTDVAYADDRGVAACVLAVGWHADRATTTYTTPPLPVAPYVPGDFKARELPCLLAVLALLPAPPEVIVVDGHVWLDATGRPGLGAHLHDALGHRVPVVGIAKNAFQGREAIAVTRGGSSRPLYVTAVGLDAAEAARHVAMMHGPHRLPTLLRDADHLGRQALAEHTRRPE